MVNMLAQIEADCHFEIFCYHSCSVSIECVMWRKMFTQRS